MLNIFIDIDYIFNNMKYNEFLEDIELIVLMRSLDNSRPKGEEGGAATETQGAW